MKLRAMLCTAVVTACFAGSVSAATVYIQDYEAGVVDPFNLQPDFSGTSQGIDGLTDALNAIADDGAAGSTASAEIVIPFVSETTDSGLPWQLRFLPNSGGAASATNITFAPDGYVGYYLKVDPSVTADMLTGPVLEDPGTGTATVGTLKSIIRDGQWHLYEWNMDDVASDFTRTFNLTGTGVYGSGGTLGDLLLQGNQSFDSIAILSNTAANATIRIDQIGFNNAGSMAIPEPAALGLLSMAGLAMIRRRH